MDGFTSSVSASRARPVDRGAAGTRPPRRVYQVGRARAIFGGVRARLALLCPPLRARGEGCSTACLSGVGFRKPRRDGGQRVALESHPVALSAAVPVKKLTKSPLTDWVASLVPPCNAPARACRGSDLANPGESEAGAWPSSPTQQPCRPLCL